MRDLTILATVLVICALAAAYADKCRDTERALRALRAAQANASDILDQSQAEHNALRQLRNRMPGKEKP